MVGLAMTRGPILVVDDDQDNALLLCTVLQDRGFQVIFAPNGEQGLAAARTRSPSLICLDVAMPAWSGVRMYRELRNDPRLQGVPVLMMNAVPDELDGLFTSIPSEPWTARTGSKRRVSHLLLATIEQVLQAQRQAN